MRNPIHLLKLLELEMCVCVDWGERRAKFLLFQTRALCVPTHTNMRETLRRHRRVKWTGAREEYVEPESTLRRQ